MDGRRALAPLLPTEKTKMRTLEREEKRLRCLNRNHQKTPHAIDPVVAGERQLMSRFIVLVQDDLHARAFGSYRSFKAAEGDAKAWGGVVIPLEGKDAREPWNPAAA